MGIYVNPGNSGFAEINDQDYVDKTMLIEQINRTVGKKGQAHLCQQTAAFWQIVCRENARSILRLFL